MSAQQKIAPFLWFDGNVEEAMNHYVSIFKNSRILSVTRNGDAGPGPAGTESGGAPGQGGWPKDKFGLWWQIVPRVMVELLKGPDPEKARRVMQAMMQMTRIDIARLQHAARSH